MIPLYTEEQFKNSKSRGFLPIKCEKCGNTFYGIKNEIQKHFSRERRGIRYSSFKFCSVKCNTNGEFYSCKQCGKSVYRTPSDFRKKLHDVFCSHRCAAIYTQKDGGHCHWSDEDKKRLSILAKNNPRFCGGWNKGKHFAKTETVKCNVCGKEFVELKYKLKWNNKTKTCSKECRNKMQSIIVSNQYKNGKKVYGGTTKWLNYKNIRVQGSYEYRTCVILDKWLEVGKIKNWEYTKDRFEYIGIDTKKHNYLMDFKVWNNDDSFYYLEVKGFQKPNDELKWKAVKDKGFNLKVWFNNDIKQEEKILMANVA